MKRLYTPKESDFKNYKAQPAYEPITTMTQHQISLFLSCINLFSIMLKKI